MEKLSKETEYTTKKSTQISRVLEYYTVVDEQTKIYKCNICTKNQNGKSSGNLVAHFKASHKEIYMKEINNIVEEHIQIQREKVVHSCVELVTINSHPFSLLSQSGFRNLLENKLCAFQSAGYPLNLSDRHVHEIKDRVHKTAKQIKELIKIDVKDKLISVMVDSATRNGRSVYGMSLQYKHNDRLKVVVIGMRELRKSHTAVYLTDVLIEVLAEYSIDLKQII